MTIEAGDYVTIGDNELSWLVEAIHPDASANGPQATLASGQSGRRRYEPIDRLTIHTKREDITA